MNKGITTGYRVLVTGAGGFVGRAVVSSLQKAGYQVRILVRKPSLQHNVKEVCGSITDPKILESAVTGVDAVIHMAARKSDEKDSELVNVEGARLLSDCCRKNHVRRLVNVSTQSVRLQKRGVYGRTKLAAEEVFTKSGLSVITLRPSVVYDDEGGGIFSTILQFLALPVIPMIGDGAIHFRPIHKDDLASIIVQTLSQGNTDIAYDVGGPDVISLAALTAEMQKRQNLKKRVIQLPLSVAMIIARLTMWMRRPPITVSNVLGASEDLRMDIEPMLRDFGVLPRSIHIGLDAIFRTKKEALQRAEAIALLHYAFSGFGAWQPSKTEIEQYQQALILYGADRHLLSASVIQKHWLLGACDAIASSESMLRKKLLIAAAIGECSPSTAEYTLPKNRSVLMMIIISSVLTLRAVRKKIVGLLLKLCAPTFIVHNAQR